MSNPDSELLWQQFLQSIYDDNYKPNEEEEEEEVNDPEYRINEDLLKLDDEWNFKVSDYELDLLLDEDDNEMEVQSVETAIESTPNCDVFDKNSVKILVSQLSQHIQLLAQTYFQSFNTNGLQSVAQNANSMLIEINEISKSNPLFSLIDVNSSVQLIGRHPSNKSCETSRSMTSWRTLPVSNENQRIYISNPNVFRDLCLLPICGFCRKEIHKNKMKASFTLAEDHLIALGLEQFSPMFSLRKCYRYLKQLLLPTKTVDQIRTHIKNIKRRSNATESRENPIMYYYLNGRAPDLNFGNKSSELESYSSVKNTPEWYRKAIKEKISRKDFQSRGLNSSSNSKKFRSGNERKKYPIILPNQSPVKQTNSIVKKYKYLNRLNQYKQNLSVVSNPNSKNKKYSNKIDSNQIQVLSICDNLPKNEQKLSQTLKISENIPNDSKYLENINKSEKSKTQSLDKTIEMIGFEQNEENLKRSLLNEISINEDDVEYDDESDLAALMTASSTITTKNKMKSKTTSDGNNCSVLQLSHNKKEGRKSLAVKQRESTLQLLSFEKSKIDSNSVIKDEILVQTFLEKVRKSLSHESYVQFLTLLSNFLQKRNEEQLSKNGLIKNIFTQIENFLKQSNVSKDIISELVLFLSAEQAEECGKMFEYLYWKRVFNYITKLENYSLIDGQCLSRFYRSLNQLKANYENCDENLILWTVNRSLNGHSYLMHHFSSLLLDSKPSEYLFEDQDFDEVVVDSSDDEEKTDISEKMCFETINIPESDDDLKFGTNECQCNTCHKDNQTITTHCTSCSIRFIGGRVFLTQNHKKLCLAEIHFTECDNNCFEDNEEDIGIESDKEIDVENQHNLDKSMDKMCWTITDDKMLLELCRSKVLDEKHNDLSEEVFEEVAIKLSKDINEVITRFNILMELFASEQESHPMKTQTDQ